MKRQFMRVAVGWMLMVGVLASGCFGVVLCVGEDGHLAVEPGHHTPCGQTQGADEPAHDAMPASDARPGSCGTCGCVDVVLGRDALLQNSRTLKRSRLPRGRNSRLVAVGYVRLAQTAAHGCPQPVCGVTRIQVQFLLEKRTIVLLV